MTGIQSRGLTRYTQKHKDEARRLRDEGLSYNKIAERIGASGPLVVRRWLDEGARLAHNRAVRISRGYEA